MLRSMYSGISGMKVNQTKLDVIGNNIANVNTTSFKSSRATFSDLLSQSSSSAQAASATKGGVNGQQVGLGVQLASIDRIMTQGSMQSTSRALDVGIDGNGYFMVATGPAVSADGAIEVSQKAGSHAITSIAAGSSISYSRDGSFTLDNEGNLLTTDGYRVLGYSLTNDDSTKAATAESPSTKINIAGLNFSFGPGTQLNGATIRLGQIGSGTATSAALTTNGNEKILTINGDFSSDTSLTADEIKKAISNELATKGISQTVDVVGTIKPFSNIGSTTTISGGTDAEAPDTVSCFNYNFKFTSGGDLNGRKIVIGDISKDPMSVDVNDKEIVINANFIDGVSTDNLKDEINKALETANISTRISKISGNGQSLSGLKADVPDKEAPVKPTTSGSSLGFSVDATSLSYGSGLNNYEVKFVQDTGMGTKATCTRSGTVLTVTADFTNTSVNLDTINNAIKSRLSAENINMTVKVTGSYDAADAGTITFSDTGKNSEVPSVNVGGFTINLPSTETLEGIDPTLISKLNNLSFQVVDITSNLAPAAKANGNTIEISGNFSASGGVASSTLETALNAALKDALGNTHSDIKVSISGSNTVFGNTSSDEITGGSSLEKADPIQALGLTFSSSDNAGATFNGYSIQIGDVNGPESASGKVSVGVDKTNKVIKISANFAGENGVSTTDIANALRNKLEDTFGEGIYLTPEANGTPISLNGQTSSDEKVEGGTSVQSIGSDGTVNYVSASTTVYSYDSSLKTLKIPEYVTLADGSTSAVKSYSISDQGVITATLENGNIAALGQIALANFSNPAGLTSNGGNLYSVSSNSGDAVISSGINTVQDNNSDAYGSMLSGYLEMSNVDLAEQFTDMITTTKAFQGASKMITTGDEILSEIINLKR